MPHKKILKASAGDEEEWIMSYADTVTLLLCFFVIFFSQSKLSGEEEEKVEEQAKVITEIKKEKEELVKELLEREKKVETLEELKKRLVAEFEKQNLKGIDVERKENEVVVRLSEKEFFSVGSYKLIKNGQNSLGKISTSLQNINEQFEIFIEGHTDSKPVLGAAAYKSNLGLSSLRASTAAEVLVLNGLETSRVRVVGYGDSKPLAVDRVIASETNEVKYLEDASSMNRRVEVRLVYPKLEQ